MNDQKPDFKNAQLDFSEFHPLMHRWASPECFRWYGGPWRHMELWWQFQSSLPCLIGRHDYWGSPLSREEWRSGAWEQSEETDWKCMRCGKEKHGPRT